MTLDKLLAEFYKKNGIPSDGGINKNTLGINKPNNIFISFNFNNY